MPEWNYQPLGVVAPAVQAPFPAATDEVWNLSLDEIESGTGRVVQKVMARVSELGSSKCSFGDEHVLYSKLRPYLNKVVVPDGPGVGTSELIPLRPRKEVLERDFLAWYLRSPAFLEFSAQNTRGANLPRIAMDALWEHKIPTPPIVEQRRIVSRIREAMPRVEEVRRLRAETAREADAVEAALVADLLASMDDDVGEVPLGQVLIRSQYGTSQKATLTGAGVPVYRMGNIQRGRLIHDDMKYVELPAAEARKYALQPGDILINRTNSLELVGKAACVADVPSGAVFASYLVRLIIDRRKAVPEFVSFVINSRIGRDYVLRTARRAIGMVNINSEEIGKMPIPLPKLAVQEAMVAKFAEVRQACDALRSELSADEVEALPAAILRKAFSGVF